MGANELRIVRRIEDSIRDAHGPRIHVIKSRDITNSRNFADKVFRVLKMHGYIVNALTMQNINDPAQEESPSTRIYAIDEDTVKNFVGDRLNEIASPMQYLFDESKLAYMKRPILISVVSDSFYERYGVQKRPEQTSTGTVRKKKNRVTRTKSSNSTLAVYSFYLAAFSFFLSGVNSIFGSYFTFSYGNVYYISLPFGILILSLAAIAVRAFSLGEEEKRSVLPVMLSIVLFILLLIVGIAANNYGMSIAEIFSDTGQAVFSASFSMFVVALAFVVMIIALSRYILFLGSSAGTKAYLFGIAGLVLLISVVLVSNLPPLTIFGTNPLNPVSVPSQPISTNPGSVFLNFVFDPEFPVFGTTSYFSAQSTAQYILLRNYLVMFANVILGLSYMFAVKSRKILQAK